MRVFRSTIKELEVHPSARRHGVSDADIEHAVRNAMFIDDQEDRLRLYIGCAYSANLLEVITVVYDEGSEMAIHAMSMRPKYVNLLPLE